MSPTRFLEINWYLGFVLGIIHDQAWGPTTVVYLGPIAININWGKSWTGY